MPASNSSRAPRTTRNSWNFSKRNFPKHYAKIRFPNTSGIGIKNLSSEGTERLFRSGDRVCAHQQAQERDHCAQGQHPEIHRRFVRDWAYAQGSANMPSESTPGHSGSAPRRPPVNGPQRRAGGGIRRTLIKDAIADITLQQVLTRADEFDVVATMNLNGDYLSDALAAQVGGIGIASLCQHQLHDRACRVRSHARHRPEICRPRSGQSRLGDSLGRDDAALHGLDRGRRCDLSAPWTAPSSRR